MTTLRQNRILLGVIALLLLLAACKGESPTSPTSTPPATGGGGGGTTSTGTTVTLAVANSSPTVSTTTTLTATVTVNGTAAANGTAVEFSSTAPGIFIDTNTATSIRTTTGGVATATLTSASAGAVTVTARVGTVAKTATVTFAAVVTQPGPGSTAPTITSFTPTFGKPQGGDVVTITGTNFRAPARVLFDTGSGTPKEGTVSSVTATQIVVVTPAVDLGATTPTLSATITVIVGSGTATEERVNAATPFTFQIAILTPAIFAVSPPSGSKEGGTIIKITGQGFQSPLQVTFGTGNGPGPLTAAAEVQVLTVNFNEITAVTPPFPATDLTAANGQVTLRVLNIASNTQAVLPLAFRYLSPVRIIAFGPTEGPFTGGTRVTIDGQGFDDPVAVSIGGVAAQVISVSGTKIVAITSGVAVASCADVNGPVIVTNISAQDTATSLPTNFIFRVLKPAIIGVSPNPATAGSSLNITVANAVGNPRLTIGTSSVTPQSTIVNPDGTTTFVVTVPASLTLGTVACASGGTAPTPTPFNVVFTSTTTTCTDTFTNGLTVNPPNTGKVFFTPPSFGPFTSTSNSAVPPAASNAAPSASQTVTLVNTGGGPLSITGTSQSAGCSNFSIGGVPTAGTVLAQCDSAAITAAFTTIAPTGFSSVCTLTFATDAGTKTLTLNGTVK
jgi:hypothetical protein